MVRCNALKRETTTIGVRHCIAMQRLHRCVDGWCLFFTWKGFYCWGWQVCFISICLFFVYCLLKHVALKQLSFPSGMFLLVCPGLSSLSESPLTQTSTSPRLFFPLFPSVSCLNTSSLKRHPICEPVLTFLKIYKKKTLRNFTICWKGPHLCFQ